MLDSIQHEFIRIPRYCKSMILGKLKETGIQVSISGRRYPRKLKNAGLIYKCSEGKAIAEFLKITDGFIEDQFSEFASILLFPSSGFFHESFHRSENKILRNKVKDILYSLKDDKRTEVVKKVEDTFLHRLKSLQDKCKAKYPNYSFGIRSSGVGSLTTMQGHELWIECGFPNAKDIQADNVALSVGVKHLTTKAELYDASVTWGAGTAPDIDIDLFENSVPFTDESLKELESKFDLLEEVFQKAVDSWKNMNA